MFLPAERPAASSNQVDAEDEAAEKRRRSVLSNQFLRVSRFRSVVEHFTLPFGLAKICQRIAHTGR